MSFDFFYSVVGFLILFISYHLDASLVANNTIMANNYHIGPTKQIHRLVATVSQN